MTSFNILWRGWRLLWLGSLLALAVSAGGAGAATASPSVKVVYHLNEGIDQASRAMNNIRNHLKAAPDSRITVVAHGEGINFLLEGAADKRGNPFDAAVQELAGKGVDFRVCQNTLTSRAIDRSKVLPEAIVVPSGVAEVARLQAAEGYVYLRP